MRSPIILLGAPSAIGIRPYEDGTPRHLDQAPRVLRQLGLVTRLGAVDAGDIPPPPYLDLVRPDRSPRNEAGMVAYSRSIAAAVSRAAADQQFVVLLGGDCSILLGCLLGARQDLPIGLAYIDGHADFATPALSRTGSVASMDLALAVGRGDTPLAGLGGSAPLVREEDVAVIGRRDHAEERFYGEQILRNSAILDLPAEELTRLGADRTAGVVLERVTRPGLAGFWIHLDVDVLDPMVMPAVDSPEPGGPGFAELAALLAPLVRHPKALGLDLTIYDPSLDPDLVAGQGLVHMLADTLRTTI
jgi:arginase